MNKEIDKFLKSNIKCFSCGEGPISFSLSYDDSNNLVSKYGDFCSMGCHIDFYNSHNLEIEMKECYKNNKYTDQKS